MTENTFVIAKEGRPYCALIPIGEGSKSVADLLVETIEKISNVKLETVDFAQIKKYQNLIILGNSSGDSLMGKIETGSEISLATPQLGQQGFVIKLAEQDNRKYLILIGETSQGIFYAMQTLTNRLYWVKNRLVVDNLYLQTKPAFEIRSIFTNMGGPDSIAPRQWEKEFGTNYKQFIDFLASYRINNLILMSHNLGSGIAYNSKKFPELVNPYKVTVREDFMREMIDYAHSRYIEVFFQLDFPDHTLAVAKIYPQLAGNNFKGSPFDPSFKKFKEMLKGNIKFSSAEGWLCGSKPQTMQFWQDYIEELLTRYPNIDGIGLQPSEGRNPNTRCNCKDCQRTNYFDINLRFFKALRTIAKSINPRIKIWFFSGYGSKKITKDKFPDVIKVDWDAALPIELLKRRQKQIVNSKYDWDNLLSQEPLANKPFGDWFLFHTMGRDWEEFRIKQSCVFLHEIGVKGYQNRVTSYHTKKSLFQAFSEFTWNPDISMPDICQLYLIRKYRRKYPQEASLLARLMEARGYYLDLSFLYGYHYPDQSLMKEKKRKLELKIKELEEGLGKIAEKSEIITFIEDQFQVLKEEYYKIKLGIHETGK